MSTEEPTRRSSHVEMPAAYAAVGASKLPDLLRFPPDGSTPYEEALQLGSGQDRFIAASSLLMTWGAQRGTGIAVTDIDRGTDVAYVGPEFDEQGRAQAASEIEEQFGPDGEPYLVAGSTAVLTPPGKPSRSVLVVYTVNEDRIVGFAWGTSDENGAVGEQRFTVEFRDDDTVWAVARGFLTSPKNGLLGLKARSVIRDAIDAVREQIGALAPGVAPIVTPADEALVVDTVAVDDPKTDEPTTKKPVVETAAREETVGEETLVDDTAAEDAVVEDAVVEDAVLADPDAAQTEDPTDVSSDPGATQTHQRRPSKPQS